MKFKLGGIPSDFSTDFEQALSMMEQDGLQYADVETIWGKRVGTHTQEENHKIKALLDKYHIQAAVVAGFAFRDQQLWKIELDDDTYRMNLEEIKAQFALARLLGADKVRILTFAKQSAIWGANGAERRNANNNQSWDKMLKLFEQPVQIAEDYGIDIVFETQVNTVLCSAYLIRKFVEDLGTKRVKILWDPANTLFNDEIPFPDSYEVIKDLIGHIHIKDGTADSKKSTIVSTAVGEGTMAGYLEDICTALKRDQYDGIITLENFYIPAGGKLEDGYRASIGAFQKIFG